MDLDAFLADSVVVADGKLYAHGGGWNVLRATGLPVRQPRIGIGVILTVGYMETDTAHALELSLEDQDGGRLDLGPPDVAAPGPRAIGTQFHVPRPAGLVAGDDQTLPLAFNLDGLVLAAPGVYRFSLAIDGVPRKHLPFRVTLNAAPSPPGR